MIEFPDLLGMVFEQARERLESQKIPYEVFETIPTKKNAVDGFKRVIKQKNENGICHLTVCKVPDVFL